MFNIEIHNKLPDFVKTNTIYEINGIGYIPKQRNDKITYPIIWETLSESRENEKLDQFNPIKGHK